MRICLALDHPAALEPLQHPGDGRRFDAQSLGKRSLSHAR
jgi:hypothetical protein